MLKLRDELRQGNAKHQAHLPQLKDVYEPLPGLVLAEQGLQVSQFLGKVSPGQPRLAPSLVKE